jgi:archaellum component FlaC
MAPPPRKITSASSRILQTQKSAQNSDKGVAKMSKKRKKGSKKDDLLDPLDNYESEMLSESEESISDDAPLTAALLKSLLNINTQSITDRIDKLDNNFQNVETLFRVQEERIVELKEEVAGLQNTVEKINTENELLWKEIHKMNLVFSGVHDSDKESLDQLYSTISRIIRNVSGGDITFDLGHRVGKFRMGSCRPIKVRFLSMFQRDSVFANRFKSQKPVYINEDLPRGMRRDNGLMRNKKRELVANGYDPKGIKMDWNKKSIQTNDSIFKIKDGEMLDESPDGMDTTNHIAQVLNRNAQQSSSSNSQPVFNGQSASGSQAQSSQSTGRRRNNFQYSQNLNRPSRGFLGQRW